MQNENRNCSFEELSRRELLKCSTVWWVGLVSTVAGAIYAYLEVNPCDK